MKIGYNKVLGIVFLLFGLFNCCLTTVFVRTDESIPPAVVASFWFGFLVGILLLIGTYMEITQNNVVVKSLFGFVSKRYTFNSAKDFSIERKIYVLSDGVRQKMAVSSWMADKRGRISLIKWIEDARSAQSENSVVT